MSEGAWKRGPWDEGPDRPARLPRVEDLPAVEGGYAGDAVDAAFAAFHDHAAKLDRTLQVLESVSAFHRQAEELRGDIRALRAAAWGPLPVPRSSWGAAYATRAATRSAALPAALPRLAVEAAFIILVAVGASLAEVATPVLVGLVIASWAIVGLIEVLVASRGAQRRVAAPSPVAAGPLYVASPPPRRVLEDTQEEAVIFEPAPELEAALEYEPELAAGEEPELDEDEEVEEDEDELPPAAEADEEEPEEGEAVADPWADVEPAPDDEAEDEPEAEAEADAEADEEDEADTGEHAAVVSLLPEPEPEPEPQRRRFWQRKKEQSPESEAEPADELESEPGDEDDERLAGEPSFGLRRGRR